jgi:proteasome lid subunit RPN8/RPN11
MKITIHSVNNSANEELAGAYDEADLLDGVVRSSDNAPKGDPRYKLVLHHKAVREIFDFIEWDKGERPDSRNEQGGILFGKRYYDAEKDIHFAVVSKAITADNAVGSSGYLDITQECWRDMHKKKDDYNEETDEEAVIVGWFHTHPNSLSCFMSGTDRNTQNLFFDGDNTYSIVFNPQRHLLKAFRAKECYAAQAFLITDPAETEVESDG